MSESARGIGLQSCLHDRGSRYELHVAVVMTDHVHMILTPLMNVKEARVYSLPEILDRIKGASAHLINRASGQHGTVWQEESFDHVLRSSESLIHKVQYVLANPVRAKAWRLPENTVGCGINPFRIFMPQTPRA